MTPEDKRIEREKVLNDVFVFGEGYMKDGKRIDPKDIYKDDAMLR